MKDSLLDAALEFFAERGIVHAPSRLARITEMLGSHENARSRLAQSLTRLPRELDRAWRTNLFHALKAEPGRLEPVHMMILAVTCELEASRLTGAHRIDADLPQLALSRNGSDVVSSFPEVFRAAPVSCLRGQGPFTRYALEVMQELGVDFRPYGPVWAAEVAVLSHHEAGYVLDRYADDLREALGRPDGSFLGEALLRKFAGVGESRRRTAQHLLRMVSLQELGSPSGALELLSSAAWYSDDDLCMQIASHGYLSDEDIITCLAALRPDNDGHSLEAYGERLVIHAKACRARGPLAQPATKSH